MPPKKQPIKLPHIPKPVKKEIKSTLQHAFDNGQVLSRDDWLASYDKFLAEFQDADKNNDGKLDREEYIAKYGNDDHFDYYDLNGDGTMDADEWAMAKQTEKELKDLDADGDGKITREEWIACYGSAAGYDQYDLDGDGIIDANEFRKAKCAEIEFGRLDKDGDGVVSREEWIAKYGTADGFDDIAVDGVIGGNAFRQAKTEEMEWRHLDTDHDGQVSREEYIKRYGSADGYDAIDADGKGGMSRAEFRKGNQKGIVRKMPTAAERASVAAMGPSAVSTVTCGSHFLGNPWVGDESVAAEFEFLHVLRTGIRECRLKFPFESRNLYMLTGFDSNARLGNWAEISHKVNLWCNRIDELHKSDAGFSRPGWMLLTTVVSERGAAMPTKGYGHLKDSLNQPMDTMAQVAALIAQRGVPVAVVADGPQMDITHPRFPQFASAVLFAPSSRIREGWAFHKEEPALWEHLGGVLCVGGEQPLLSQLDALEFEPKRLKEGPAGFPVRSACTLQLGDKIKDWKPLESVGRRGAAYRSQKQDNNHHQKNQGRPGDCYIPAVDPLGRQAGLNAFIVVPP